MRVTIGQMMLVVALAALNLAMVGGLPWEIVAFPTIWAFLAAVDLVAVRKLILQRPLRAFHYTCLIVSLAAYLVTANLVATGRLSLLGPLVRGYQQLGGGTLGRGSAGFIGIAEFWAGGLLSLALGGALGRFAAWLEKSRGWDIAAFLRGALVGLGTAGLLATLDGALRGWGVDTPGRATGRLVLSCVCLALGGLIGLRRLKSRPASIRA